MLYRVVIEPQAAEDMQGAINYYDALQIGLGERFYNALSEYIDALSSNPFYQIRYKTARAITIKQFPYYQIIFTVAEESKTIYVNAVFNCAQNPEKRP